jgi:radical SAM superfamily enzyme YgiQ (UPF0313 family)
MSGIRAHDPELLALGLTLPGFVERSRQIAALPSLGLLYLAAMTPPGHELHYFEAESDRSEPAEVYSCDLVAISTFSAQVLEACAIADRLRRAGARVAMGGLHVSVRPVEAALHADYVMCGEGESAWPAIVEAASAGAPPRTFDAKDFPALVSVAKHHSEFADDNTFVDKAWGKDLCRRLAPLRLKWFTETDISVADDPKLLDLMAEAGCRQVLIGLESPGASALEGMEMRANFKARRAESYAPALKRIQAHGITVNGCFILGLDEHGPEVFGQVLDYARSIPLYDVQITILTPFPGPLYDRLLAEGRLVEPERWDLCTLFDVNYRPKKMSIEELRSGMRWLTERLYSAEETAARRKPFFAGLRGHPDHRPAA